MLSLSNAKLSPINVECLAAELSECTSYCLIDVRPSSQHCCNHIKNSENVNFTNILLRRLAKGVVKLNTHISNQTLVEKLTERDPSSTKLILYDNNSKLGCIKSELLKHAEVLYKTSHSSQPNSSQVYYVDGKSKLLACQGWARVCVCTYVWVCIIGIACVLSATASLTWSHLHTYISHTITSVCLYTLTGGFTAFSQQCPTLCESNSPMSSHRPIGISVSASLPINFGRPPTQQKLRAQTPMVDESSQFGPPVEILPFLVLGCARDSSNLTLLRQHGVTAVLNVSHNCACHFEELFEYKVIPVQDSHQSDLLSQLDTAFHFISKWIKPQLTA